MLENWIGVEWTSRRKNNVISFRERFDDLMRQRFSVFWTVRAPGILGDRKEQSERTLEIGCGTGNWTSNFAGQTDRLVALDLDFDRVLTTRDYVTRRSIENALFIVASGDALPFASQTFDRVYCIDVIEHIRDDENAICEISRVLQLSGRATVTTMLIDRPSYLRKFVFVDHVREYSPQGFSQMFANAALQQINCFIFYSFFSTIAREIEVTSYSNINKIPLVGVAFRVGLSLIARLDRLGQIGAPSGIGILSIKAPR